MPIRAPEGYLDITNATLRASEIVTTSNVGIANANPTNTLSIGSNVFFEDTSSNLMTVRGNVVAEGIKLGFLQLLPSYDLELTANVGNSISNTVQFTNSTTGFITSSNVGIGTNAPDGLVDVGTVLKVKFGNLGATAADIIEGYNTVDIVESGGTYTYTRDTAANYGNFLPSTALYSPITGRRYRVRLTARSDFTGSIRLENPANGAIVASYDLTTTFTTYTWEFTSIATTMYFRATLTTGTTMQFNAFSMEVLEATANTDIIMGGTRFIKAHDASKNFVAIGPSAGFTSQGDSAVAVGKSAGQTSQGAGTVAVGNLAGNNTQGNQSTAVGTETGQTSQGVQATALGHAAGRDYQGSLAVAVGSLAGFTSQGTTAVAVGRQAGQTSQGSSAVAVGNNAGNTSQGASAVAVGINAGNLNQGNYATAVGFDAGSNNQGAQAVAVGYLAGYTSQGTLATALGNAAGRYNQGSSAVAVGDAAGVTAQGTYATALGVLAGYTNQGAYATAVGNAAGQTSQGVSAVAVGDGAGRTAQGAAATALGAVAGETSQSAYAVAVGSLAGQTSQGSSAVAVGYAVGQTAQGAEATAVGNQAGQTSQSFRGTAVGYAAGQTVQGNSAVAVGRDAGTTSQGAAAVAVGYLAGATTQGIQTVAVGCEAGRYNQSTQAVAVGYQAGLNAQGDYAIAVGTYAGQYNQHDNSIVLNASGAGLNTAQASSFYVKPVRGGNIAASALAYTSAGEIVEETNVHFNASGNVGIGTASPNEKLHVEGSIELGPQHSVNLYREDTSGGPSFNICNTDRTIAGWFGYGSSSKNELRMVSNAQHPLTFWTSTSGSGVERMRITPDGDVGINDASPSYKLDVSGTLRAYGITDSSDRRIKSNIVDVNDASALETIRLLKPKKYDYRDTENRTHETVWGFIAQDVREVLPYATDVISDYIPNVMEYVNVSSSNVLTFDTSVLESNVVNLRLKDIHGDIRDVTIDEIIDGNTIRVIEDLDAWTGSFDAEGNVITATTTTTITVEEYEALEDTTGYESTADGYTKTTTTYPGSQIFVYGQKVDDFHTLQKNAIWTVATAALQEVDRQLQAEKVKTASLESQVVDLLARVTALENI